MNIAGCPVCGRLDTQWEWLVVGNLIQTRKLFACRRCGRFSIDDLLTTTFLISTDGKLSPYLSFYLRRNQAAGEEAPSITEENWEELALAEKAITVPQKLERLLQLIADRTEVPGRIVQIDRDIDGALFSALTPDEVNYLLNSLQERQFLELSGDIAAKMKVKGWEQIMPQSGTGGIPGTCFVAMSFDSSLNQIFDDAIFPAAEACGFKANRIDRKLHNGDINDAILAEVKKSQFVIADFTGHRAGVYFEAGFARGLGREVIWCCRDTDFKETHFDTNHYSHVVWSNNADLKKQLTDRILATISNSQAVR
jgi:hypothetical protein